MHRIQTMCRKNRIQIQCRKKTEIPPREVTLVANLIDQFKITSKKTTTLFNYYDNEKSEGECGLEIEYNTRQGLTNLSHTPHKHTSVFL